MGGNPGVAAGRRHASQCDQAAPPAPTAPPESTPPPPQAPSLRRLLRKALQVSVVRTLYLSARCRAQIIVFRGTRVRLSAGARILVDPGGRLLLGADDARRAGSVIIGVGGRLTIHGKVVIWRGSRILILRGAHLEIGHLTRFNCDASVTCLAHIVFGADSGLGWNSNVIDGNAHEITVAGVPRPRTEPIRIGDKAWIGTGATVSAG